METIEKQAYEKFYLKADYTEVLGSSETISSYTVTAQDKDGTDVTSTIIENSSEIIGTGDDAGRLLYRVQAGTEASSPYYVTAKVETSAGNKFEVDHRLVVREVP